MTPKEVKAALGKRVRLPDGSECRFNAYILRAEKDKLLYQAEVQDLKALSVRICKLEDIETVKEQKIL